MDTSEEKEDDHKLGNDNKPKSILKSNDKDKINTNLNIETTSKPPVISAKIPEVQQHTSNSGTVP